MKIIPIFIPHAGCPYKCAYCDQRKISGARSMPTVQEIQSVIRRNLKTIPEDEKVEVAFFGGTFTFLPEDLQEKYLDAARFFVKTLRMSTHPEAVCLKAMKRFKKKGGRLVELGIQSLDKEVLRKVKRKTSLASVKNAAKCIKKAGLRLGVQIMLGLPGDTLEKSIDTAKKIVKLRPETVRIYPVLVIKGTELARQYKKGKYKPLSLEHAITQAARITDIFEDKGVKVIRIGLHPSRDLDSKATMLAGPYHPAFGEMVRSRKMRDRIINTVKYRSVANRSRIEIHAPRNMFNLISGHKKKEKKFLEEYFGAQIILRRAAKFRIKDVRKDIAIIDPRMPRPAKDRLKKLNYHAVEAPLHDKLQRPVRGHVDMMLFRYKDKVIYEPRLENITELLRQNGYKCVKGERIKSSKYPKDIIYNSCAMDRCIIHYKGKIEKNIKEIKTGHILVPQGYTKCSIIPIDKKHIITSDKGIKDAWEKRGGKALLIEPGHVKLPGYRTGLIGGATGTDEKKVFFVGSMDSHPDGQAIRDFIRRCGRYIIELYPGPLYDVGTIVILPCLSKNRVLY
ncbi:MAG: radical SAM protein [Candidatus Omnitrophica bacterium]|nr:radical SAM protein [Candidatus Omnitrophota bacterium]MBU4589413.1 radical SAM protein [Candidatus Omnitrophota bacterium]